MLTLPNTNLSKNRWLTFWLMMPNDNDLTGCKWQLTLFSMLVICTMHFKRTNNRIRYDNRLSCHLALALFIILSRIMWIHHGEKILGENVAWQPLNVFKNDLANQIYYLVRTVHPLHLHNQCLRRQLYTDARITDWNPQKQAANHDQIS